MKSYVRALSSILAAFFFTACIVESNDNAVLDVSLSATTTSIEATGNTTLTAAAKTTGSPTVTYTWSIKSGDDYATLSSTSGTSVVLTGKNSTSSEQSVVVKVKASDGTNSSSETVTITVGALGISSVTINGSSYIQYNGTTTFTAIPTIAKNTTITYTWSITDGSSYATLNSTSGESVTLTANNSADTEQSVKVKVSATDGKTTCEASFTVTLSANGTEVKDEITSVSISGTTSISATGTTTLTAIPTYRGNSPSITYTWSITEGAAYATLSATSGTSVTLTGANTSQTKQNISLKVTASDGTNTKEYTATVTLAAPAIDTDTIYLNLTDGTMSANNTDWTTITTSAAQPAINISIKYTKNDSGSSTGLIKVDATSFTKDLKVYVNGTLTTGGVKIQSNGSNMVYVYLTDTNITSSNYPCLEVTKGSPTTVTLSGTNTFVDGRVYGYGYGEEYSSTSGATYTDDGVTKSCSVSQHAVSEGSDSKGTLFSKGNLTLTGTGSLSVTQAYKNCIASKDGILTIENGTYTLKNYKPSSNTGKNGLFGGQGIVINDGIISFDGKGIVSSSDLRKANGLKTDDDNYTSSYIKINGGTTTITTYNGKGLNAPAVYIAGGKNTFTVTGVTSYVERTTTGSYYDADGVLQTNQTIKFAPEGIEGASTISISGGTTIVSAQDDGINVSNVGGALTISGGVLFVKSSGDGLDSNGNIVISGGVTVVSQTGGGNSPIDCGDNSYSFTVTGTSATVFAMGSSDMFTESIPSSTVNPMIYSTSLGTSTTSLGVNGIIGLTSPQSYAAAILISSSLTNGSSYNFVKGGSISGTEYVSGTGIYFPATVSGGSSVSATATTQKTAAGGGGGQPSGPGGGGGGRPF
ncbi:MAG: carbohydrate-binding domain-containing protein [Treponema sp.]|nr:carbohydrate-binding domain-containing protein [Treponema sp.]